MNNRAYGGWGGGGGGLCRPVNGDRSGYSFNAENVSNFM